MWSTLANGEVQTTVELFCLTFRVDVYIRYVISDAKGVLLSGSEDTQAGAVLAATCALRRLLSGCRRVQKDQIERLLQELTRLPIPLTKPVNRIHPT